MSFSVCKNCGSSHVEHYFHLRNSPLLQNVLSDQQQAALTAARVDGNFLLCADCGLLFNADYHAVNYSENYDNNQTASPIYNAHIKAVAEYIQSHLHCESQILEIGCGNGAVLAHLVQAGFPHVLGFDPVHSTDTAYISKQYWQADSRRHDCIILRHVLEAIDDYNQFLTGIAASVAENGFIYLEISNARILVEQSLTALLYHECRQYFCEYSAAYALRRNGFYVHQTRHFMGGEILGLIARRVCQPPALAAHLEKLGNYTNIHIWGIAGRSIHFLTHYSLTENIIRYGVDIDPQKQGMYIPITGQKIISPAESIKLQPDCIILLNCNYLEEVLSLFPYPVEILTSKELYAH